MAAQDLGLKEVPVHVATGLTETQVRGYRLADNRIAEIAEWDDVLLSAEIEGLLEAECDLNVLGFTEFELARLSGEGMPGSNSKAFDEGVGDDVVMITCPACQHEFPK